MNAQPTIHATGISVYRDNPEETARNVWGAMMPLVRGIARVFDEKKARAEFLAHMAFQLAGGVAAELGEGDAADMFEMVAKAIRECPPPAARTH